MEEIKNVTLEDILAKYFECKKPFLKTPTVCGCSFGEKDYNYFTKAGGKAYSKLTGLLYDLQSLCSNFDANGVIEELDNIVNKTY